MGRSGTLPHDSWLLGKFCNLPGSECEEKNIPSNNQVSEYTYFGYYIHILNCIIVTMVLCFSWLSYSNDDTAILTILCNYYASYASHIYIFSLIDESESKVVGYLCLWEGKISGSKFLHLFNSCYHMVGRSSEVSFINIQWHQYGKCLR